MPRYIPSDNPQKIERAVIIEKHISEYRAYGPPPPSYWASRAGHNTERARMIYADHSTSDAIKARADGGSYIHPCSPEGQKTLPAPTFSPEMTIDRRPSRGFFDPPMNYITPQVLWEHHPGGWQSALAHALTMSGVVVKGKPMTGADVQASLDILVTNPKYTEEKSHTLYHPGDRGTAIFQGEVDAAFVARWGGSPNCFSLIIVCPYVRADGVGWGRIWDTHNRPPIIVRWSVGDQAKHKPLVLMCIPIPETVSGRQSYHKAVEWFTMKPAPKTAFAATWDRIWKSYDDKALAELPKQFWFKFGGHPDHFIWTIVMLHSRIAQGVEVPDAHLGSWIWQYGEYLQKSGRSRDRFKFDQSMKYGGRQVTYHELTAWILKPIKANAHTYAKRWDDAIQGLIDYNIDKTDAKWARARKLYFIARKPFW